jgi:hypothetical protein
MKQWMNELTVTDSVIFCLLLSTLFYLVFNFEFLPVYHEIMNSSDILFIEEVAQFLNQGGRLFDWRLTQAPYYFPDIFLARIFTWLDPRIGQASVYYQAVNGLMLLGMFYWICKLSHIKSLLTLMLAATLYLFSYVGSMSGDSIANYYGIIGCHSGVNISILLAIAGIMLYLQDFSNKALSLMMVFVSVFIGTVSDSLVAFATFPFITVYAGLCWKQEELSKTAALNLVLVTFFALLMAKGFGYTVPFPQDLSFLRHTVHSLPESMFRSIIQFPTDFIRVFFRSPISALLALLYFGSCAISIAHLLDVWRSKEKAQSNITLLSLFILISPLLVIFMQISLGIYQDLGHTRQWSPLIYLAIVFGSMIVSDKYSEHVSKFKIAVALILFATLIHTTVKLSKHRYIIPKESIYATLANCMKAQNLPEGPYYAADYWFARPVRMYSGHTFGILPVGGMKSYSQSADVATMRKTTPRYIITGNSVSEAELIEQFGKPAAEYCTDIFPNNQTKVFDYSSNAKFKAHFQEEALKSK